MIEIWRIAMSEVYNMKQTKNLDLHVKILETSIAIKIVFELIYVTDHQMQNN